MGAPPNSTKHYISTILISKMSQKSITSFFTRKAPVSTTTTSDGDGGNDTKSTNSAKTPTKNKEQKNIINEDSKKVQNSPLREPNQIKDEPEVSLDSPIKQTKKANPLQKRLRMKKRKRKHQNQILPVKK